MDSLWNFIVANQAFFWGLALGLLITFFTWKSAFSAKRNIKRDLRRVTDENKTLQGHLNTQMKVSAEGTESLTKKVADLQQQNETLRINLNSLQQKPGRGEVRQLALMETAVSQMREQAPGFAQAWEQALRRAEAEQEAADGGLRRLVRKVLPGISHRAEAQPAEAETEETETEANPYADLKEK